MTKINWNITDQELKQELVSDDNRWNISKTHQREACENYIRSQVAKGWQILPEHYDDGGFSGGNTKRPGLQKLLEDCQAGKVDIIVIYKLDRLSRSLCDFAELSKMFDEYHIDVCSVTQESNTSTSAGRMMLNILMTFATSFFKLFIIFLLILKVKHNKNNTELFLFIITIA